MEPIKGRFFKHHDKMKTTVQCIGLYDIRSKIAAFHSLVNWKWPSFWIGSREISSLCFFIIFSIHRERGVTTYWFLLLVFDLSTQTLSVWKAMKFSDALRITYFVLFNMFGSSFIRKQWIVVIKLRIYKFQWQNTKLRIVSLNNLKF